MERGRQVCPLFFVFSVSLYFFSHNFESVVHSVFVFIPGGFNYASGCCFSVRACVRGCVRARVGVCVCVRSFMICGSDVI